MEVRPETDIGDSFNSAEELRQLNDQRKALLPETASPAPQENGIKEEEGDSTVVDPDETQPETGGDGQESEEDAKSRKKRRRGQSEKQQKRDEEREKEKAQKAAAAKQPPLPKEFIKLLKEIQKKENFMKKCEEEVAVIDNDLREADCPRTRILGKDRFWNRYYWFERNGMPYAGLPTSSTASAGYANGCIWVQGPDDMEREGYIDLPRDLEEEYKSRFSMTVAMRKAAEEGGTSVTNAQQWGYISKPEQVDDLIKWLDTRGNRESKLRKELLAFRDQIVTNMTRRAEYVASAEEKEPKEETKRMSSRIRDKTPEPPNYKCLQWENTTALEELGHLHSEPPPPPRPRKQGKKREAASDAGPGPATKTRRR